MLKFHPYSILTGDTMVGFVIFCVLKVAWIWLDLEEYYWPIRLFWIDLELWTKSEKQSKLKDYTFTVKTVKDLSLSFMDAL